jgi:hypothetical protein
MANDTWRAAVLTAIAGLMAGIIGAGAGVVGTLIASGNEDDRTRQEFLRTQRLAAYAEFAAVAEKADALLSAYVPVMETRDGDVPLDMSQSDFSAVSDVVNDLRLAKFKVQMLGGGTTASSAKNAASSVEAGWLYLQDIYCRISTVQYAVGCAAIRDPEADRPDLGTYNAEFSHLKDREEVFARAAQEAIANS